MANFDLTEERPGFSGKKFGRYLSGILVKPRQTLRQIHKQKTHVTYGLAAVLLFSIWYGIAVFAGFLNGIGATDSFAPFLRIPNDQYYLWEAIFMVPVSLGGWIIMAGIVQLVARRFGGRGDFESSVALLGWTYIVMIPASLLPEFVVLTFFPSIWFDPTWMTITTARVIIFTAWNILVTILAIKQAQQLGWGRSVLVTIIAFIPTILLQIVFIR